MVVGGEGPRPAKLRAFRAGGRQGVNFARNVWHHPLLVLDRASLFLIVDRKGPGDNLEEISTARRDDRSLDAEALKGANCFPIGKAIVGCSNSNGLAEATSSM